MFRRRFLALVTAGAVAGCGSDNAETVGGGDDGDGADGTPTSNPTPTHTDYCSDLPVRADPGVGAIRK